MKASFIDVDGIRTRYLHDGQGEPLLLIHGFGFSADVWVRVLDALAARFQVVAPDVLGHGFTDWVDAGKEPAPLFMARHLSRFLDVIGIKCCVALGSSLGGVLAALMYLQRPHQITKLIFDAIHTPVSDTGTLDPDGLRGTMKNGVKALTEPTLQSCIDRMANICFDRNRAATDVALMQVTIYAQPDRLEAYTRIGDSIIAHARNEAVRIDPERIAVPSLFLCGRQDIRIPIDVIQVNHHRVRGSRMAVFENCGHLPEIEHPERFVAEVTEFITT